MPAVFTAPPGRFLPGTFRGAPENRKIMCVKLLYTSSAEYAHVDKFGPPAAHATFGHLPGGGFGFGLPGRPFFDVFPKGYADCVEFAMNTVAFTLNQHQDNTKTVDFLC